MIPQELMKANMQEWTREAARLQRQDQARVAPDERASSGRAPLALRIRRPSLPPFAARVFRSAPTS
jgi:hypothetical protein